MSLTKSKGNMYPWVTHTHSHLRGTCPHGCTYCYVQAMERRYKSGNYSGPLRLDEKELSVSYGSGKTIFIEHCNDLFANDVQASSIGSILGHVARYPANTYVFQTKNPKRMTYWIYSLPRNSVVGTTIESTRYHKAMGNAPPVLERAQDLAKLGQFRRFVTIEPIMQMNVDVMLNWLQWIAPEFVNIGADSKGSGLDEPTKSDVLELIDGIGKLGIEIKQKRNLNRLLT